MTRACLAPALLLALAAVACSPQTGGTGPARATRTSKEQIINGRPNGVYREVGVLRGPGWTQCNATLVAPDQALTSADCVKTFHAGEDWSVNFADSTLSIRLTFVDEAGHDLPNANEYAVRDVAFAPGYDPADSTIGASAVLILDRPVAGITPAVLGTHPPSVGDLALVVGYGVPAATDTSAELTLTRRSGFSRLTSVDPANHAIESWNLASTDAAVCAGDAGAPIFVNVDGAPKLVGIVLYGGDPCTLGWGGVTAIEAADASGEGVAETSSDRTPASTDSVEAAADAACREFTTCEACAASEGCGFCAGNDLCLAGDASGPTSIGCDTWYYHVEACVSPSDASDIPEPSDPCTKHLACGDCTLDSACGFCLNDSTCHTGSVDGAQDGSCSGADWAYTADQCWSPDAP